MIGRRPPRLVSSRRAQKQRRPLGPPLERLLKRGGNGCSMGVSCTPRAPGTPWTREGQTARPPPGHDRSCARTSMSAGAAVGAAALHEAALLHLRAAFLHRAPAAAVVTALVEKQPAAVAAELELLEGAAGEQLDGRVGDGPQGVVEGAGRRPGPAHRAAGARGIAPVRAGARTVASWRQARVRE